MGRWEPIPDLEKGGFCDRETEDIGEQSWPLTPLLDRTRRPLEMVVLLALLTAMGLSWVPTAGASKYRIPVPLEEPRW